MVHDRSWEDVERQIEEVAGDIRARAGRRGIRAKVAGAEDRAWSFLDPARWCADRDELTVGDLVRFASIAQACNCLFGCGYDESSTGPRRSFFTPASFRGTDLAGWKVWFPHLGVEGIPGRWTNSLDPETGDILEAPPEGSAITADDPSHAQRRVVFVKGRQPVTGKPSYQFAGCYKCASERGGRFVYRRFSKTFSILH